MNIDLKRRLAAIAMGVALLCAAAAAEGASYTISVDASKVASGNPRFWSAAVGTGTASLTLRPDLQTHYKLANRELGMQRVRGHGVLNDDMGIFHWTGGSAAPTYDWTKFDQYLAAIVAAGMRPAMELSFMPTALAKNGNSRDPAKDLNIFKQFIQAVVQHCIDKYGATDVGQWYWEVWNEPNYSGFWNGTQSDYFSMYDAAVAGATAALPNIIIGGPVTTQGSASYITAFLQHTKSANVRVSFVSSHAYPGGAGPSADATFGVTDNNSRVSAITGANYTIASVPSLNSEWNSSYSGQGGNTMPNCVSMDTHVNAPFIIKSVKLLADKDSGNTPPLQMFSYWTVSDVFDESSGPSGSYILAQGGNLPFGSVFGLLTFQGVRKAAYNGFKMLNYLGTQRLTATGGSGNSDGVDAFATMSAASDEVEIIVYNYYATVNTTGSDTATVTLNNLPFAGQPVFVTQFAVDSTHSNPYSVWQSQGSPKNPTEAQWQAMKAAQHLLPVQPVTTMTASSSYTANLTIPKQGAVMIIVGKSRPVTGRNGLVELEGEDYDGQSGITKETCSDTTMGQSVTGDSDSYLFFDSVDFSDAGVGSVQLRVNAQTATTLELHADTQAGTLLGKCSVAATAGSWATQSCTLTPISGVHTLYAIWGGTMRLNHLKFQQASGSTGTGGAGGTAGSAGSGGGSAGRAGSSGGAGTSGAAGSSGGAGATGGTTGAGGTIGTTGTAGSTGGSGVTGAAGTTGRGGTTGGAGSGVGTAGTTGAGTAGSTGSGGTPGATGGSSGCSCNTGNSGAPSGTMLFLALIGAACVRKRRSRHGR